MLPFNIFAEDSVCPRNVPPPLNILTPVKSDRTIIKRGELLKIKMSLPFDLTPPPGVQKRKVWKDWRVVFFIMSYGAIGTQNRLLKYVVNIMRLRPSSDNSKYLLYAEILPFMPDGLYSLTVSGPGFRITNRDSFCVGSCINQKKRVEKEEKNTFKIIPSGNFKSELFEVVVKSDFGSLKAVCDGREIFPLYATWQTNTGEIKKRDRVLLYKVDGKKNSLIEFVKSKALSIKAAVKREDKKLGGALDWQRYKIVSDASFLNIIWDFKDDSYGMGKRIIHRWILSKHAASEITLFDKSGAVYYLNFSDDILKPSNGCGCSNNIGAEISENYESQNKKYSFFKLLNLFFY
ncbi:MAG: hypothetical protein JXR91_07890 [Deltaproteobacteria bacterium]|nr:hypothetical protein [Deltaproteobacteria bacterium]